MPARSAFRPMASFRLEVTTVSLSNSDRVIAGLASACFCYRVLSAIGSGVYDGGGDPDVRSDRHPGAFVATLLSGAAVAVVCAWIALAPNVSQRPGGEP